MSFTRCNSIKDLNDYRAYRRQKKAEYRQKTGSNQYNRRRWKIDEIKQVIEHKIPDRELSKKISRSVTAIQKKRYEVRDAVREVKRETSVYNSMTNKELFNILRNSISNQDIKVVIDILEDRTAGIV